MMKIYGKLHLKNGTFLFTCAFVLCFSLLVFPHAVLPAQQQEWTQTLAHSFYYDGLSGLLLWFPLFSLYLTYHQRYFTPDVICTRFHRFFGLWKNRLTALFFDVLLFAALLEAGCLLFYISKGVFPQEAGSVVLELRCFIVRFFSLFLYAFLCSVLSAWFRQTLPGLAISYGLIVAEYFLGLRVLSGYFLFLKGFLIPGTWLAAAKMLLLYVVLFTGLLAMLWGFVSRRDCITAEKG